MTSKLLCLTLLVTLAACAAKPDVISTDFTRNQGVYILAYGTDSSRRQLMENQLVADLGKYNIIGYPSHKDLTDINSVNRTAVLREANSKRTVAVVVVNQVAPNESGLIENPLRVSPEHSDLMDFFEYSESLESSYKPNQLVFAEVNTFWIDGAKARLAWSGTSWSFRADGAGGAIRGMSETIADELKTIRDTVRNR